MPNIKAKELLSRAVEVMPRACQTMSKCYMMWPMDDTFPIYVESQDGCVFTSVDGEQFIDMMGGLGPNFVPQKIVNKEIMTQLKKGISFSLSTPLEVELAELVKETVPCAEMVRFCKNGSDAVTAAVRIARSYAKKDYLLMAAGGYHGWGDQFCAVSQRDYGMPKAFKEFVDTFEYNNVKDLEEKLKTGKYAALIMEPVSLEEPKKGFLKKVRELCTQYNTILIFDEMITCYRWALGGAQDYYGVVPDITTMGKAAGGGMPLAFVAGKKEYMKELEQVFFSATYFGESLSLAAGIATIKELKKNKDKIYPHVWRQGKRFKKAFLTKCKELNIDAEVLGMAPRMNLKFNHEDATGVRDLFHAEMMKRGVFMGIQVYVTWATKKKHIDKVLQAMNESLEIVADAIHNKGLDFYLHGQRSMQVFKRQ